MTVADLINVLSVLPREKEVRSVGCCLGCSLPVREAKVVEDKWESWVELYDDFSPRRQSDS